MARGITETDVHTAADELVAKGERPTVERIRAHLGTGSPNTVTRWLETWWNRLGTRLQPARPDLEDAPAMLVELAGQWWELALKQRVGRESLRTGPKAT
ncbi:DNA-binding protein [Stenotrophomonas sp. S11A1a]|uniref:DNA-binding protein n=1 Tax=Stenotrophomonas TaxID=40323 RepID=UPI0026A1A994